VPSPHETSPRVLCSRIPQSVGSLAAAKIVFPVALQLTVQRFRSAVSAERELSNSQSVSHQTPSSGLHHE
jgi:hypothetical protein